MWSTAWVSILDCILMHVSGERTCACVFTVYSVLCLCLFELCTHTLCKPRSPILPMQMHNPSVAPQTHTLFHRAECHWNTVVQGTAERPCKITPTHLAHTDTDTDTDLLAHIHTPNTHRAECHWTTVMQGTAIHAYWHDANCIAMPHLAHMVVAVAVALVLCVCVLAMVSRGLGLCAAVSPLEHKWLRWQWRWRWPLCSASACWQW